MSHEKSRFVVLVGSSSLSFPSHKRKVTGLIPGGGTQNLFLVVTVLSPKLVTKMVPAYKVKKLLILLLALAFQQQTFLLNHERYMEFN